MDLVKKWKSKYIFQFPVAQQLRGSRGAYLQSVIITTTDFSNAEVQESAQTDKTPITLMISKQLMKLLMDQSIGVRHATQSLFKNVVAFTVGVTRKSVLNLSFVGCLIRPDNLSEIATIVGGHQPQFGAKKLTSILI